MPISPLGLLDRVLHGRMPQTPSATSVLPLQGVTVLAVEDSRFASDALRLMCQRSGARLRRVETLHAAYAHLRVYRPDVMLVDLGLPDGRGDTLICDLAHLRPQGPIVIGISGDARGQAVAFMAGAHGFIEKPFPPLSVFQSEILRHLPDRSARSAPDLAAPALAADPLALQDDLEHAAQMLRDDADPRQFRYVAGFVEGLARSMDDAALADAARCMPDPNGLDALRSLLSARLDASKLDVNKNAFSPQLPK
jgi:DNA-binding response OmpR family regulator